MNLHGTVSKEQIMKRWLFIYQVASSSGAPDDWELDPGELLFHEKIASGAFGDLFRGTYCGQEVAIKILRNVHDDSQQYQEFLQVRALTP